MEDGRGRRRRRKEGRRNGEEGESQGGKLTINHLRFFMPRRCLTHNGPREVNGFFIRPKEIQKDILETHSALSHTCFQIKTFRSDDAAQPRWRNIMLLEGESSFCQHSRHKNENKTGISAKKNHGSDGNSFFLGRFLVVFFFVVDRNTGQIGAASASSAGSAFCFFSSMTAAALLFCTYCKTHQKNDRESESEIIGILYNVLVVVLRVRRRRDSLFFFFASLGQAAAARGNGGGKGGD